MDVYKKKINFFVFRMIQYCDVCCFYFEFIKFVEYLILVNFEVIVLVVLLVLIFVGVGIEEDEICVKVFFQWWFNYVCSSEVLVRDFEMVFFVESDFGYSFMVKKKQLVIGVCRKILKQFVLFLDDIFELQEVCFIVKLFYLGVMDVGYKVDKFVKLCRGMCLIVFCYG